jgi:hypothetical protein
MDEVPVLEGGENGPAVCGGLTTDGGEFMAWSLGSMFGGFVLQQCRMFERAESREYISGLDRQRKDWDLEQMVPWPRR